MSIMYVPVQQVKSNFLVSLTFYKDQDTSSTITNALWLKHRKMLPREKMSNILGTSNIELYKRFYS